MHAVQAKGTSSVSKGFKSHCSDPYVKARSPRGARSGSLRVQQSCGAVDRGGGGPWGHGQDGTLQAPAACMQTARAAPPRCPPSSAPLRQAATQDAGGPQARGGHPAPTPTWETIKVAASHFWSSIASEWSLRSGFLSMGGVSPASCCACTQGAQHTTTRNTNTWLIFNMSQCGALLKGALVAPACGHLAWQIAFQSTP